MTAGSRLGRRLRALHPDAPPLVRRSSRSHAPHPIGRWLHDLGADPAFADAVLGDLAEEYAERASHEGVVAARRWYVREALRSAPHLLRSAIRHRGPAGCARVVADRAPLLAVGAAVTAGVVVVWRTVPGPPARLVSRDAAAPIVINNDQRALRLPVRVLDAAGHVLPDTGVRFRWESGTAFPVTADGAITCTRRGDAIVRATFGGLATRLVVQCRPIHLLRESATNDFVLGDPPRQYAVTAVDKAGRVVPQFVAWLRIGDATIATIVDDALRVRALHPGITAVRVDAGDHWLTSTLTVYERVASFAALAPEQQFVAVRARLVPGASVRYALPTGYFRLATRPELDGAVDAGAAPSSDAQRMGPRLTLAGPVACRAAMGGHGDRAECLVTGPGATITATHPAPNAPAIVATLTLERLDTHTTRRPWVDATHDSAFARAARRFAWEDTP